MSKSESTKRDSCDETWAMRQEGRGLVAPSRKSSCRCGRCRLYRYYPPLLMASTALTAVFCFLYLTKPVFFGEPVMNVRDAEDAVPREHLIALADPGDAESAARDEIRPGLDPGLVMFPAEPRVVDPLVAALSQPEPLDLLDVPASVAPVSEGPPVEAAPEPAPVMDRSEPMPVRVSVARRNMESSPAVPGELQPLRIEPTDRPLFQSLTKADLARLAERKAAKENPEADESAVTATEDPVGPETGDGEPDAALVAKEGGEESDEPGEDVAVEEPDEPGEDVAVEEPDEPGEDVAANEPDQPGEDVAVAEQPEPNPEVGPVLRASLIGEFYLDEETDDNEEQSLFETAMLWKGTNI